MADDVREAGGSRSPHVMLAAVGIYLRAAPGYAVLRLLLAVTSGLAPIATAWLTKTLIDDLTDRRPGPIGGLAVGLAAVAGLMAVTQHVNQLAEREISRRVTLFTQARLFQAVTDQQGLASLEDPAYHDRVRLAQQASQAGPQVLVASGLTILQSALTVGGFVAGLWTLSPMATVLVLLSAGPTLAAQLALSRQRSGMLVRTSPFIRRQIFYSQLLLDLRAAKEIRLFGLGGHFRERMLVELRATQRGERHVDRSAFSVDGSLALLTAAVSAVALYQVTHQIAAGHGRIGDLAVLIAALAGVQGALAGIVAQIANASQILGLFAHYVAVIDEPRAATGAGLPATQLRDGIRFEGVWFRYGEAGPWVLADFDLTIDAGRCVALVGLNGAGKSTVVKLLCRLYEPTRGRILWNGTDIRDIDPDLLRRRIGAVFQDFMCYDLTAHDNITLGSVTTPHSEEQIVAAARDAGIDDYLRALPAGYQTMLSRTFVEPPKRDARTPALDPGEGVSPSGGQWQRVAIARALLRRDTDLLILDEPSSGLDAEAEAALHARLRELRSGRTSLLISHRLGAVREADVIVVLEQGRVTEIGDHDRLISAEGTYARLFALQAAGYRAVG